MRTAKIGRILLLSLLLSTPISGGTGSFDFDFTLQSDDFPALDKDPTITGEPGEEFLFTANMIIGSANLTGEGAQGWSMSIWHGGVDVESISIKGTVSATQSEGGLRSDDPDTQFLAFEFVDPARNFGREGVVQAVVLGGPDGMLPINTRQVVGRIMYRATVRHPGTIAFIRYEEDLRGSGQPVTNIVTVRGETQIPTLGEREITIGQGAVPETGRCEDGLDNDGDGWVDCGDPNCAATITCGAEDCLDGADNDGDGLIDCSDPDCERSPDCREICDDGIDNDRDGQTDCEDVACLGAPGCPSPEICGDRLDNDEDGLVDCDDPDCERASVCRDPEVCDDGIDNDEDGLIDCADPQCRGVPPCPGSEICDDALDNDHDGLVDCDDPDCTARVECREAEDCEDGIDNDLDGRADCEDFECAGVAPCPPREVCDDSTDNDGDGLVDCDDPSCEAVDPCGAGGFDLVLASDGSVRDSPASDGGAGGTGRITSNVVSVPWGESLIEVVTYVVPFPEPQSLGAAAWSLSIAHDRSVMEISGTPTIEGTDAESVFAGGFEQTETVGDSGGGGVGGGGGDGADGVVSAVALSFGGPQTLDPAQAQSILRIPYRVRAATGASGGAGGVSAGAGFQDGLQGSGQPVVNILTIQGQSVEPLHLVGLQLRRTEFFLRGDANDDGKVNIADAIWSLNALVRGGPSTPCEPAADFNRDGRKDVSDAIYLAQYLFLDGPIVPPPYPECGGGREEPVLVCPEGAVAACP